MGRTIAVAMVVFLATASAALAEDLIRAANGRPDYQIIVLTTPPSAEVGACLNQIARLIQTAFKANGCDVPVVGEEKRDLVRMDVAEATRGNPSRLPTLDKYGAKFLRPWHLYTKNGGVGDPTKATRGKGAKIVAGAVERISDMFVEFAEDEYDGRFPC